MTGAKGRILIGVLALLTFAGGAAAATTRSTATPKNPAFMVTVKSTIAQHHVTHIVRKADPTQDNCRWRSDIDTAQTISVVSRQPVRMTLNDLVRGGAGFVAANATIHRTGTSYTGWEQGCPLLANQPAAKEPASSCGKTKHFYISDSLTQVGYTSPRSTGFEFGYAGVLLDPFGVNCLAPFWGGGTGQEGTLTLSVPPLAWQTGATKRKTWTAVKRSAFLTGKPVVVRFKTSGTVSTPTTSDPSSFDESVYTDTYTVSWTVTLKPTK